jgi:hypothetical protein
LILIISNIANEAATALVDRFPVGAASLITASEFHASFRAGIAVSDFSSSGITIRGAGNSTKDVSGVVTTIPCFLPQEFYYIEPADRNYVCSEMNAFFIYFLSELTCPKLNPPSTRTLSGMSLQKIEWMKTAHTLDIPVWPFHLKNSQPTDLDKPAGLHYLKATIIGDTIIGDHTPDSIATTMIRLSKAFSLPYLSGHFFSPDGTDYFLSELISVPDINPQETQQAIVNYFLKPA